VLSILYPLLSEQNQIDYLTRIQDRLLGCLDLNAIVNDDARSMLSSLIAHNAVPDNKPPVQFSVYSKQFNEEDHLAELGVPVDDPVNIRIRELEAPIKAFNIAGGEVELEGVNKILPALRSLKAALSTAISDGAHSEQVDWGWGILTTACARCCTATGLECDRGPGKFIRFILLEASIHDEPQPGPLHVSGFEERPAWGGNLPRIEAAQALPLLARFVNCADEEVLEAINILSRDPVPEVRYQIATRINYLGENAPDFMWEIIERLVRDEVSRGVLQGLLNGPFSWLSSVDPNRIARLSIDIWDRID